jgi:hypothetical protein
MMVTTGGKSTTFVGNYPRILVFTAGKVNDHGFAGIEMIAVFSGIN